MNYKIKLIFFQVQFFLIDIFIFSDSCVNALKQQLLNENHKNYTKLLIPPIDDYFE